MRLTSIIRSSRLPSPFSGRGQALVELAFVLLGLLSFLSMSYFVVYTIEQMQLQQMLTLSQAQIELGNSAHYGDENGQATFFYGRPGPGGRVIDITQEAEFYNAANDPSKQNARITPIQNRGVDFPTADMTVTNVGTPSLTGFGAEFSFTAPSIPLHIAHSKETMLGSFEGSPTSYATADPATRKQAWYFKQLISGWRLKTIALKYDRVARPDSSGEFAYLIDHPSIAVASTDPTLNFGTFYVGKESADTLIANTEATLGGDISSYGPIADIDGVLTSTLSDSFEALGINFGDINAVAQVAGQIAAEVVQESELYRVRSREFQIRESANVGSAIDSTVGRSSSSSSSASSSPVARRPSSSAVPTRSGGLFEPESRSVSRRPEGDASSPSSYRNSDGSFRNSALSDGVLGGFGFTEPAVYRKRDSEPAKLLIPESGIAESESSSSSESGLTMAHDPRRSDGRHRSSSLVRSRESTTTETPAEAARGALTNAGDRSSSSVVLSRATIEDVKRMMEAYRSRASRPDENADKFRDSVSLEGDDILSNPINLRDRAKEMCLKRKKSKKLISPDQKGEREAGEENCEDDVVLARYEKKLRDLAMAKREKEFNEKIYGRLGVISEVMESRKTREEMRILSDALDQAPRSIQFPKSERETLENLSSNLKKVEIPAEGIGPILDARQFLKTQKIGLPSAPNLELVEKEIAALRDLRADSKEVQPSQARLAEERLIQSFRDQERLNGQIERAIKNFKRASDLGVVYVESPRATQAKIETIKTLQTGDIETGLSHQVDALSESAATFERAGEVESIREARRRVQELLQERSALKTSDDNLSERLQRDLDVKNPSSKISRELHTQGVTR